MCDKKTSAIPGMEPGTPHVRGKVSIHLAMGTTLIPPAGQPESIGSDSSPDSRVGISFSFFLNMFIYPEQRAIGTHQFSADCQRFKRYIKLQQ